MTDHPSQRVLISAALPGEADALTEIAFAAKRHWGYPDAWIEQWRAALTITAEFIATHEVFAARKAGSIAGFAALVRDGGILRLEHLWVRPGDMGRGVGSALFRHSQQRASALGFETFEIESDPSASGFYLRMGAEQMGTSTSAFLEGLTRELPVFRCHASRCAPALRARRE
ncbi:MAG: GNAT family N-acetyltransferase [Verrucomicrobiaceae bacterium]|nr:GNAT family N-acetyltransferase [Verrucomicrobiaceae bacterium]